MELTMNQNFIKAELLLERMSKNQQRMWTGSDHGEWLFYLSAEGLYDELDQILVTDANSR